jgi:hypothetical protein
MGIETEGWAIDKTEVALEKLAKESPLTEMSGLSVYERIVIATIVGNSFGLCQRINESDILQQARRNGLTHVAVVLALKKLSTKLLIQSFPVLDSMNEAPCLLQYTSNPRASP